MNKIILITGGARSGKSSFAESLATKWGKKVHYIATSQIFDKEMAYRVKLHKKRRPQNWETIEAPFDADLTIKNLKVQRGDVILFDCLTLYLSNFICHPSQRDLDLDTLTKEFLFELDKLLKEAYKKDATFIFVTNEVGSGIVPENKLARDYRDLAGIMNQKVAKNAEDVYLVASGIPIKIKGEDRFE